MTSKCIAIVAGILSTSSIKAYISNCANVELLRIFECIPDAQNYLEQSTAVDFIVLDIEILATQSEMFGKLVRTPIKLLIFTASPRGSEPTVSCLNNHTFLLKPFDQAMLAGITEKTANELSATIKPEQSRNNFFIKCKGDSHKLFKVSVTDIIAVESLLNYIKIYTTHGNVVTHLNLKEANKVLGQYPCFIQIHRSFIVSKEHIAEVEQNKLTMSDGSVFNIGNNFKEQLYDFLAEHTFKPHH